MTSWRGDQLKKSTAGNLPLPLPYHSNVVRSSNYEGPNHSIFSIHMLLFPYSARPSLTVVTIST